MKFPAFDADKELKKAIRHFWKTRGTQSDNQGLATNAKDTGNRTAVTGGKHMDGFIALVESLIVKCQLKGFRIHYREKLELPGWFRPQKRWDLVVIREKPEGNELIACLEFKSHIGSFGNNFNNRTEEALGNSTDLLAAFREGAFKPSSRPWVGYLMLLEDSPKSRTGGGRSLAPHFPVFPEFVGASYQRRYDILLTKLVRERLYDSACFLMSSKDQAKSGGYTEPNSELTFQKLIASLLARIIASSQV